MRSLSNLFRTLETRSENIASRKIGIRNLPSVGLEQKGNLSIKAAISERNTMLEEAQKKNEIERNNIDEMRRQTIEDIEAMKIEWETKKAALQQEAYDEGFQTGFDEGRNKAYSEMATSVRLANEATDQSHENATQYLSSQERVILDLAMQTADRIMGEALEVDEEKFLSVVRKALKEVQEMKEIKLYVSIDYHKLVSDNRAELASIFPPDVPLLIFVNDDFDSTECYIETNHGRIIVGVDEQLSHLREQLIEILESGD